MQRLPLLLLLLFVGLLLRPCAAADKYALLIGVTKYQKSQMNEAKIDYPEADAVAVGKVLEASGYTVVTLLGQQATKTAIDTALQDLEKQGAAGGVVLIGLFGHGVQYNEDAWFCPWDTTIRKVRDSNNNILRDKNGEEMLEPDPVSMISMKQLLDALNACGADNRVIFADCCREDPSSARSALLGHRAFGSRVRTADLKEGTAALFSCSKGERAFEHAEWGHGALTKAFLDYYDALPADGDTLVSTMTGPLFRRVNTLVQGKDPKATQKVNPITNGIVDLQLKPRTFRLFSESLKMRFVTIPAGTFRMGSPDDEAGRGSDEGPQHTVRISRDFRMAVHEVTRGQFAAFVRETGYQTEAEKGGGSNFGFNTATGNYEIDAKYNWRNPGYPQTDDHPVVLVTWNDAKAFCEWLSRKDNRTYRLPTEAEWEYACRSGSTTRYWNGDDQEGLAKIANVGDGTLKQRYSDWSEETITSRDGHVFTAPVGSFPANAFGLHDMHGNVWEWCADWFDSDYYENSPAADPQGPGSGSSRVLRGGSWYFVPYFVRCAYRDDLTPGYRGHGYGFRVVLE